MTSVSAPQVSFCIPTYNRCRYLGSLLESLLVQLAGFPFTYELVIADNASTDATAETIAAYADRLPIRALRHAANIGGYGNWQFVQAQAAGRYVVYVADDDSILGNQVASAVAKMEADPELAVVYAPWLLFDLVAQQSQGQFFNVPHDLRIERNEHVQLLDHVLRHHIFPEIQIIRRDVLQATMPRVNEHAFFAFVHAADYLTQGAILIQRQPFYVSITRYFADEAREQIGNSEVEHAWDRYRGGLEYMIARAPAWRSAPRSASACTRADPADDRLAHGGRDPPAPRQQARSGRHLSPGDAPARPRLRVAAAGTAGDAGVRGDARIRHARRRAAPRRAPDDLHRHRATAASATTSSAKRVPVEFLPEMERCGDLSDALLFVRDDAVKAQQLDSVAAAAKNVRIVRERDVAARFGL